MQTKSIRAISNPPVKKISPKTSPANVTFRADCYATTLFNIITHIFFLQAFNKYFTFNYS